MVRHLTVEERVFICEVYFKHKSARRVRMEFVERFPKSAPPARTTIHAIVNKLEASGSVLDRKHYKRRSVLTQDKLDEIAAVLEQSPDKSKNELAQQTGVSPSSARNATLMLKLKPNRYSRVQALKQNDASDLRKSSSVLSSKMGTSSSKTMKVTKRGDKGSPTKDDYVEAVVCQESEIAENEMKEFELGDAGKILLVKQKGKLSAIGTKCTHYGAPLKTGVLGEGQVRCPWHGACFNITTGDIEDFPGMDSLPCYQVEVQNGGGVKVRARKEQLSANKRIKNMATRNMTEVTTYVVVGGGPAGATAVETLRQEGFQGRIVFICKEPTLPYDRVKLSKALECDLSKILLRSAEFYKNHGIEVMTGTEVVGINTQTKQVKLSTGNELQYSAVFIATGSTPRRPSIPGADLKNIFVLRTIEEANSITSQIGPEKHVVILGSSFIGMEMAASCAGKVKSVTVIGKEKVPFERVLGERIGARLMNLHQENGVTFRMESGITKFLPNSDGDAVGEAELSDGSTIPVDFCVLGIGSTPATKFLEGSEVNLHNGTVSVDKYLETNVKGVFAGGDIAYAPVLDTTASIGHWQLAHYHGRIAALNMLGKETPLHTVPFFWTMLFGKGVRYAGYAPKFDDVVFGGDVDAMKFVAHYCDGDVVRAVATIGSDPVAAKFAQDLLEGKQLLKSQLSPDPLAWTK